MIDFTEVDKILFIDDDLAPTFILKNGEIRRPTSIFGHVTWAKDQKTVDDLRKKLENRRIWSLKRWILRKFLN